MAKNDRDLIEAPNFVIMLTLENTENLLAEMRWLVQIIELRMENPEGIAIPEPPKLDSENSAYSSFVYQNDLSREERLVLALAIAPHFDPTILQLLHSPENIARLEIADERHLAPTGDTALFLLGGITPERLKYVYILESDHLFYKADVLELEPALKGFSYYNGILSLSRARCEQLLFNQYKKPRFSPDFPAHLLETKLEWQDLVLNEDTRKKLEELRTWLQVEDELRMSMGRDRKLRHGYRCLFYGPSGTGKTLAATLLGKQMARSVFRVDLSMVVSKYVGETSKSLDRLFNTAEGKDWILFFDEGDALFGKRADQSGDQDKNSYYANQDIAYLLQRIENYRGLVIVASNMRKNMDDAFSRRFEQIISFKTPSTDLQKQYWIDSNPEKMPFESAVDLDQLVKENLTIAMIDNIVNRAIVLNLMEGHTEIRRTTLERCIKDEKYK